MDPASIAGLVLGVLPLIISAVENYEVTFQPFVTYRRHVKEVERFTVTLGTQRTIFHNQCQLLLLAVGQSLADILRDPNHPARNDDELSQKLGSLLGDSYTSCIGTLNLIKDDLEKVTEETKGLHSLTDRKSQNTKGKSNFSLLRQKIKISFSKTRLNDIVNDLRLHNEDLIKLSNQLRDLALASAHQAPQTITNTIVTHLKITQQASIRLHDALSSGWACEDQVEHVARMSLKVEEKCQQSSSRVRFNLAVSCIRPSMSHTIHSKPIWLAIESAPSEEVQDIPEDMKKLSLQAELRKSGARSKVQFSLPSPLVTISSRGPSSSLNLPAIGPSLDLYSIGKLCNYFRQVQTQTTAEPCMGFLEKTRTFKHFVYQSSTMMQPTGELGSISLKQLLCKVSQEGKTQDWPAKLTLARLLTLAVLRFHSTPWLPKAWSSSDIYFPENTQLSQPGNALESPLVKSQLSAITSTALPIAQTGASISELSNNEWLFNLGVVLVELGHDAPFEKIRDEECPRIGTGSQTTDDFIAARTLGRSLYKKANATYGRLVEKCLNCNFGVVVMGLDDIQLQSAVIINVVNELDTCVKQYKALNALAPPLVTI